MRTVLLGIVLAVSLHAAGNPILRWLVNPAAATISDPALRAILPNVQNVRVEANLLVVVESAGLSLQSLGPLEANGIEPAKGPRKFAFRFPLEAKAAEGNRTKTPLGVIGAFLNGVPLYTAVSAMSFRSQDLWHRDAVAAVAQSREVPASPLLESLLSSATRHSPLIGFAFDGYPIYGPYGWDEDGTVRRFRSSYRLRAITNRTTLPDGTELTPSQEGPPPGAEFPLGTFIEDYEYVQGSGDLDESNGRFTRTPEYPDGTYAYFLSTDSLNKLMYPYLVGPYYFGRMAQQHRSALQQGAENVTRQVDGVELATPATVEAGHPAPLGFSFRDTYGRKIRFLERVHEQPIHLLIVSADLAEFAHVHPVLQPDDTFVVSHAFANGGTYWLFVDHTPPGGTQTVTRFCLDVQGRARPAQSLQPDALVKTIQGLRVKLDLPKQLHVGQDLTFRFDVSDASTGQPVNDLEPYLGAWAHIVVVSQDRQSFIHAHPLDDPSSPIDNNPWEHTHAVPGPSPSSVSTVTGFRSAGVYRLWVQFARQGKVITVPYTFRVAAGEHKQTAASGVPPGAIRVRISDSGFEPARITAVAGKPVMLAFQREDAQNCANAVVFPELGIRRSLPAGDTVLVEIPSTQPREYYFVCGMNMYRGALVIR